MSPLTWSITGSAAALDPPDRLAVGIWGKDPDLWAAGEDDPAERLGWLDLPSSMRAFLGDLKALADDVADAERIVLLGMGGSSLAPEMYATLLGSAPGRPSLEVIDSTHPAEVAAADERIDPDRTVFVVSSKSGGTVETMSLYRHFAEIAAPERFVAVTDPGTSLEELARERGFRKVFLNPPDIGGRFSALSLFGLVPAAAIGVNIEGLLDSASEGAESCRREGADNPGLAIGAAMADWVALGRNKLTFRTDGTQAAFADWAEQLIAESTGKNGTGVVPIVREPVARDLRTGSGVRHAR